MNMVTCLNFNHFKSVSFAEAYHGYWAFASYDRKKWTRVKTSYDDRVLEINVTPAYDSMWIAYFPPFSYEQHLDLIGTCLKSDFCEYECIGETVSKRPIDLLKIGNGPQMCWIHARTHPGETQAEWFVSGLLNRLLDESCPVAKKLRERATL